MENSNNYESPIERFREDMQMAFAAYYSKAISDNVKRRMQQQAQRGYSQQRPPIGYATTDKSGLFKITRQGKALSVVMKQLANNEISFDIFRLQVFYILNSNVRSYRSITYLKKLVSNPYYAGKVQHNGKVYKGLHEPLISEEEQEALMKII